MSSTTGAMGRTQSSSIRFWIPLLLLALGLLVANTYFSGVRNEDDRQAITKATDVQVLSQQIATFAREAAGGNIDAFAEL